jgi:hypothetical protein
MAARKRKETQMSNFVIIETQPTYCSITSGITGSTRRVVPGLCFNTEGWAAKKAELMSIAEYESMGDGNFRHALASDPFGYIAAERRVAERIASWAVDTDDGMPF